MPTYQYRCTECDNSLEMVQKFADDPLRICPSCQGRLRKVFSPVGVVFKGSGFYKTDSRAGKRGDAQREVTASEAPVKTGDGTSAVTSSEGSKTDGAKSDSSKSDESRSDCSRSGDSTSRRATADKSGSDSSQNGGRAGSSSASNGAPGASKISKDPVHKVA